MNLPDDETTIFYAVNSNYGDINQFVSTKHTIEKIINEIENKYSKNQENYV